MFVLSAEGRGPFLEYLRNLGPQTVLLTVSLLAAKDFQLRCCYLANTYETAVAAAFFMVMGLAWWANTSQFLDRFVEHMMPPLDVQVVKRSQGFRAARTGWGKAWAWLRFMLRHRTLKLLEFVLLMTVIQVCLVLVAVAAQGAAAQFLGR